MVTSLNFTLQLIVSVITVETFNMMRDMLIHITCS